MGCCVSWRFEFFFLRKNSLKRVWRTSEYGDFWIFRRDLINLYGLLLVHYMQTTKISTNSKFIDVFLLKDWFHGTCIGFKKTIYAFHKRGNTNIKSHENSWSWYSIAKIPHRIHVWYIFIHFPYTIHRSYGYMCFLQKICQVTILQPIPSRWGALGPLCVAMCGQSLFPPPPPEN